MKKIYLAWLFFLLPVYNNILLAQGGENEPSESVNLQLSALSYGDSIVLRWGYDRSSAWRTLNRHGFILERISLDDNNKVQEMAFQKLTAEPVKPWPIEVWEGKNIEDDNYALMAAQALYGRSFELSSVSSEIALMQDQADEAQNRFSFAMFAADISPLAAEGLGLRYVDKDVEQEKKYIYRLYAVHPRTFFTTDTVHYVIDAADIYHPAPPDGLQAVEGDRQVILSWPADDKYSAYYIQRSDDGGKTYQRVNEYPYIQISKEKRAVRKYTYADSLAQNYKPYHYRIAGITAFGNDSPWSESMRVMGRDRTPPPAPVIQDIINPSGNQVRISWEIPETPADMAGFFVGKSAQVGGPFKPLHKEILSPQTRTYADKSIDIHGKNYYVVVSVDTAKNVSNSMPAYVAIVDSIPPSKPTGITGMIDTSGLVSLRWPRGPEPDIKGYRIYTSNSPERDLTPVSRGTIRDTTFTDTIGLNTLNENIYYSIVAVDWNYNNSEFSERLALKKPDTVPPVSPVIKSYKVTNNGVSLSWIPSSSRDVKEHFLYRREGDEEWQRYRSLAGNSGVYKDTNVTRQEQYSYAISAVDDADLESELSVPATVRIYDQVFREEITAFNVSYDPDEKRVSISWEYPEQENCHFMLYRSYQDNGLVMYTSFGPEKRRYVDVDVNKPGSYAYALKAVYPDGGKSALSETGTVEISSDP